ncbi:uncharacterized protein LOC122398699 [Colletes gigas]|uniref:uncharacterized protein LOC122398699 n=1 Tax=Colletes gigas TaxID=935657 RepID=UPI001C9BB594|nr:uncharacterized protein LOC122398699 [Colletes gigas]
MAGSLLCAVRFLFLLFINLILIFSCSANKPIQNVPEPLIQSALNSLNEDSPTHHTYKGGNLISAQKLDLSPYIIYRLTFDLTPICKEALEPCPREACTVEVKQHEQGDIMVLKESIQCMYLYPQSTQYDSLQGQENNQEQEIIENLDKQMVSNQSVELDHEIQKTGDHNDRPFIAMRASTPNYCPGCPYELNPNLPGLAVFGEQVAKLMDESIPNDFKHKMIDVIKVTRVVPISSNIIRYQLLLRMGETNCLKNAIDQSECSVQENLPTNICLVTFEEQPWQQSSRVITKKDCIIERNSSLPSMLNAEALVTPASNKKEMNFEKFEALKNSRDILTNVTYTVTVRLEEQPQSEVTERLIVKFHINNSTDDTKPQGFEDKAKDFNEFLKDFNLLTRKAESNPEINKEEVKEDIILPKKVSIDTTTNESRELYRNKRQSKLVGAPADQDVNDPEIQEAVNKALQKYSQYSEDANEPMIVEIVQASKQVVSGSLYKITAKLGTSTCPKGTKNNCQLKDGSEVKECMFSIWSRPWIDRGYPEITMNCDLNRTKRSLRGNRYSQKMLEIAEDIKDETMFESFIKEYGKTYDSAQTKQDRFKIFKKNLKVIEELQNFEQGTAKYGVTMFADLTPKEFKERYLGFRPELRHENDIPFSEAEIPDVDLPPKFDWRDHGVVTPVKDQGQCGSCWAFSVTGNIEGQYAIRHNKLLSLSEQELVDCDSLDEGCNGGYMYNAYRSIERLGGLELETDYPYDAKTEKCHFVQTKSRVQIDSAVNITSNETKMAQWLVTNGPISVAINANAMQFYIKGVSHPFKFLCSPDNLDHGVLIVGYATSKYPIFKKTLPYWIIKNSWGPRWGEQGYYRVFRGDGTCGVNQMASSAIITN